MKTYIAPTVLAAVVAAAPSVPKAPAPPRPECVRVIVAAPYRDETPAIFDRKAELAATFPFKRKGYRRQLPR